MNTLWLKIAGIAVLILVVVIAVASFTGSGDSDASAPAPASEPKRTFDDTVAQDRQNHPVVQPEPIETPAQPESAPTPPPVDTVPIESASTPPSAEPARPQAPSVVYVKPLADYEEVQAQQLLSFAGTNFTIGRLPIMQYGQAVKACKDVIERWPESWYAYQAKRILADIAEMGRRYRQQYDLNDTLLDVSSFYQQRPGTQAVPIPKS